jgi:leucyl-tRNA synthetase
MLKSFVGSEKFEKFNNNLENAFIDALDWLKEWGCSRSFGLGSRLPWDK